MPPSAPTAPTFVRPAGDVIRETRILQVADLRARKTDKGVEVEGYAAKYNVTSHDLGGFVERIAPGAFKRAVETKQDVTFLWMHDRRTLMARTGSGTLEVSEDNIGLQFKARLADTQQGRDLAVLIDRKDVGQMSFTFRAVRDTWDFAGPIAVRTVFDADLYDVSAVDEGAYPTTELALRSMEAARAAAKPPEVVDVVSRHARLRLAEADA